jgi:hypothetical protein
MVEIPDWIADKILKDNIKSIFHKLWYRKVKKNIAINNGKFKYTKSSSSEFVKRKREKGFY